MTAATAPTRPYTRRTAVDTPEVAELRKRMRANRRRRERLERDLEAVRADAAGLALEARGRITYEDMAEHLGVSRAQVGNYLAPS